MSLGVESVLLDALSGGQEPTEDGSFWRGALENMLKFRLGGDDFIMPKVLDFDTSRIEQNTFGVLARWTRTYTFEEGGVYVLLWVYRWSHNAQNSDFIADITDSGGIPFASNGFGHKQEPKDSAGAGGSAAGTTQRFITPNFVVLDCVATPANAWEIAPGDQTVNFFFGTDDAADVSSIHEDFFLVVRVR